MLILLDRTCKDDDGSPTCFSDTRAGGGQSDLLVGGGTEESRRGKYAGLYRGWELSVAVAWDPTGASTDGVGGWACDARQLNQCMLVVT
jgi:hypothetical protein